MKKGPRPDIFWDSSSSDVSPCFGRGSLIENQITPSNPLDKGPGLICFDFDIRGQLQAAAHLSKMGLGYGIWYFPEASRPITIYI